LVSYRFSCFLNEPGRRAADYINKEEVVWTGLNNRRLNCDINTPTPYNSTRWLNWDINRAPHHHRHCRRFDPGGSLDRRVNYRCVPQPRWVGARRNTRRGEPRLRVVLRPGWMRLQYGVTSVREGERERESLLVSPSSRAATSSYEGPGPSFYRCKERVQLYNGGV
jgi:hypothetical protein